MQEAELARQIRWQQDRLDLAKFAARTWLTAREHAVAAAVLSPPTEPAAAAHTAVALYNSSYSKHSSTAQHSSDAPVSDSPLVLRGDWSLDFTEGPYRMRMKVFRGNAVLKLAPRAVKLPKGAAFKAAQAAKAAAAAAAAEEAERAEAEHTAALALALTEKVEGDKRAEQEAAAAAAA
eukprot:17227-Heterococcus_DN1.PRE.1